MSVFDYPRINFSGIITLNPGTANNDDYSGGYTDPVTGQNLALIDSAQVEPRTFGKTDEEFQAWIQKARTFDINGTDGKTQQIIPAEWNYYGNMVSSAKVNVDGVQTGPTTICTSADPKVPLSDLIGDRVLFDGNITDINSEGSPPGTQFFLKPFIWRKGDFLISGTPSKSSSQWIHFTRNVNLQGDAGSGAYVYHVIEGGEVALPGFEDPEIVGMILRYYVFAKHGTINTNEGIETLYETGADNPALLQITGSFMPLRCGERIRSAPVGRFLACDDPAIPTPPKTKNNSNGKIALAPAVLARAEDRVSVDFLGSFPENYACGAPRKSDSEIPKIWDDPVKMNPKFDFGAASLEIRNGEDSAAIGSVAYTDTVGGNARGWVFDFDISGNEAAKKLFENPQARCVLTSADHGDVLTETDYYITSNQLGIYGEQNGSTDSFVTQGLPKEAVTISVYHRGRELSADACPPVKVWRYRSIPLGYSGDRQLPETDFGPGKALRIETEKAGNFLFTFGIDDPDDPAAGAEPPKTYAKYIASPFMILANRPAIGLRVLPNEDYSTYWDDGPDGPVGNDSLTFEVVYQKVLRTYYLLYPAMNAYLPLNNEELVAGAAGQILQRTDLSMWRDPGFMPITRDMSQSRRTLLQAWCRKVIRDGNVA